METVVHAPPPLLLDALEDADHSANVPTAVVVPETV
jgi:hypothetical protein